jgi:Transmembrane protein family 132
MNTAVLTGRQVSQAMKVFIVSQAGKVADVTLQSSCTVEDESVIKVSAKQTTQKILCSVENLLFVHCFHILLSSLFCCVKADGMAFL